MNYIEKIVELIIRPSRDHYHTKRLGDPQITIQTSNYHTIKALRQDRIILNKHNEHLHLSFYSIVSVQKTQLNYNTDRYTSLQNNFFSSQFNNLTNNSHGFCLNSHPRPQQNLTHNKKVDKFVNKCVIYLHANNGSRMEGMSYLTKLLEAQCNVCLFDCSGSGVSQGNYVTLGLKQARDLDCVVNFLVKQKKMEYIALWGRSMGSATALIYGSRHAQQKLSSMVLDSPFKDLQKLIKQIASEKTGLPKMFFQPLLPFVRNEIQRKTGYNISELKLKKYLQCSQENNKPASQTSIGRSQNYKQIFPIKQIKPLQKVPAMFVISKKDKFVKCHHGQKLYKRYPCLDKELHYIDIEHHQPRDQHAIQKIIDFIVVNFNRKDEKQLQLKKNFLYRDNSLYRDNQEKIFYHRPTLNNKMISKQQPLWNQTITESAYHNISIPQKTSPRTKQDYQRNSLPLNSYQNNYQSNTSTTQQQFSPNISQVNQYVSSQPSNQNNQRFSYYINHNQSSDFYNNPQFSSNHSTTPHYLSSYQPKTLPKLNSQYFNLPYQQSLYQTIQQQTHRSSYPKHYQDTQQVLSHQNSRQSLVIKRKDSNQFKFAIQSLKQLSLQKNHNYQLTYPRQSVKLTDSKDTTQNGQNAKIVSKKYNTQKTKEKISLSSTLAFQENLKKSTAQQNLARSKVFSTNNSSMSGITDNYKYMPNTHNCIPQYPTNSYYSIIPSQPQQPPKVIVQSPIMNKFKPSQAQQHPLRFQHSPQLSKLNWNTSSQTNIALNNTSSKPLFAKQQKTGPTYFPTLSYEQRQKQDPVYLSLIDSRTKAYAKKSIEKSELNKLSNRKVESTFTSMIFSDPANIMTSELTNRFGSSQINLNESFVCTLNKIKDSSNVHGSFRKQ